jgi:hypothetical protein
MPRDQAAIIVVGRGRADAADESEVNRKPPIEPTVARSKLEDRLG